MEVDHWDPERYRHSSDLQIENAQIFLSSVAFETDSRVLDIGCGDGRITAQLSKRLSEGSIIGIDQSKAMIDYAMKHYPVQQFPNLKFCQMNALSLDFDHCFDRIISLNAIHWIQDKKTLFANIKHYLSPGGLLRILTYGKNDLFWKAMDRITMDPCWSAVFEKFANPISFDDDLVFKRCLESARFSEIEVIEKSQTYRFMNTKHLENYVSAWMPHLIYVAPADQQEFLKAFVVAYLGVSGQDKNTGCILYPYHMIYIRASNLN